MSNIKISIIGAGSGCFSIALIRDLCLTPKLRGSRVCFMDIDSERLEASYALCKRFAQELGMDLKLEKTTDRFAALDGADFVINTALTAPHQRLRDGWDIARRYGFQWGGSYHVMYDEAFWINYYQFKFFESLTEDILRICPKAWHLMVANPVLAGITHLTRKYPEAKVVGLCHGYAEIYHIAKLLGLDRKGLTYEISGVNHFVWLQKAFYNGRSFREILDQWIAEESERYWAKNGPMTSLSRKRVDIYKKHGVFAIGDTMSWTGASWPWWYHTGGEAEKFCSEDPWNGWNSYFTSGVENARKVRETEKDLSVKVTEKFPAEMTDELMIPLVESIACDIPRVLQVNIQNQGRLVPGIPEDFEAEVPALISARGIQGIRTTPLPKSILSHMLRDRVAPVEMELEAFNRGRKDLLAELVLMDKWSSTMKGAYEFIDEIFALPYHEEMRGHYK